MGEKPNVSVFGAGQASDLPGLSEILDDVHVRCATDERQLAAAIADSDVLLGWDFRAGVLERVWPHARRLRWVHWAGAGVDAALFPGLRHSDVVLTNARGVFDHYMAEYALGLVLCFAKDFPGTVRPQIENRWDFRHTEPVRGKSALIVGAGSIGSAAGALLKAAGMCVAGVGRTARRNDPVFGEVYAPGDLDRLLGHSDYVVNVTPSTPETRGLFSAERFQRMKSGARFINLGRGDAVNQDTLRRRCEKNSWPAQRWTRSPKSRCPPAVRCGISRM